MLTKLDDASWHFDTTSPRRSEAERWSLAAAHLGMLARWACQKGWLVPLFDDMLVVDAARLTALHSGGISGSQFVLDACDGKLFLEQFSEDGRAFIEHYVGENGAFADDAQTFMGKYAFKRHEGEYDFEAFSDMVDGRFDKFNGVDDSRLLSNPAAIPQASVYSLITSLFTRRRQE